MDWQPLNLDNILTCAGVYGWRHQETWLYIGQSKNLSKRLNTQHKPLRIALSLDLEISYWYIPHAAPVRLERQLHKLFQPLWCGGLDIHARYPGHPSCIWMKEPISREEIASAIFHIGFEGYSTHSFRRTALTRLSNAGVPLRVIQEISGHADLGVLQKYLAVSPEQVKSAIANI